MRVLNKIPSPTLFLGILMMLLIASCSSIEQIQKSKLPTINETVSLPTSDAELGPSITNSEKEGIAYGPSLEDGKEFDFAKAKQRNIVLGLFLGAGGARVFAELELLKEFEKNDIVISAISGVGLGAVVAAYYASDLKISMLEWKLYLFFEKSKGMTLYSKEWIKVVDEILLKPLEKFQIDRLKYNLTLPLYSLNSKKTILLSSGDLRGALLKNLLFLSLKREDSYISALGKNIDLSFFKKKLSVDYIIGVNPLEAELKLKHSSGFLIGNLIREANMMKRRLEIVDLQVKLPHKAIQLDSAGEIAKYLIKVKKISEMVTLQLKYTVKQLKENVDI